MYASIYYNVVKFEIIAFFMKSISINFLQLNILKKRNNGRIRINLIIFLKWQILEFDTAYNKTNFSLISEIKS